MKKVLSLCLIIIIITLLFSTETYALSGEEISAPSVILTEGTTGKILFEKSSHELRQCASLNNIMTLLLCFEAVENGKLSPEDSLFVSAEASAQGGIWLREGESMSVDELIRAVAVVGAADAATVLAEKISGDVSSFVSLMNERAKELSMNDTCFKNITGEDEEGQQTSAFDITLVSRELIKHRTVFNYTLKWIDYVRDGETQLVNTNKLIKTYNGITGLKTGTTEKAGSCICATAERDGLSLIAVVLGCKTPDERFKDAGALLDFGFSGWTVYVPQPPVLNSLEVSGGMKKSVSLISGDIFPIIVEKGRENSIEYETVLPDTIEAPVERGDIAGEIVFRIDGEEIASCDILFSEEAEKISFLNVLKTILESLGSI